MLRFRTSILISFLTAMLGSDIPQSGAAIRSQSPRQGSTPSQIQNEEEANENLRIKLDAQRCMGHELREG